jgi:Carboxypeptidase regulatory-like domain
LHDTKEEAMIRRDCGTFRRPFHSLTLTLSNGELAQDRLSWCRRLLGAAALLAITATAAAAQFDRGKLSGTIKDEQGAVMPGVTVTARSLQTEQVVTTVTDGTGFYTFPI